MVLDGDIVIVRQPPWFERWLAGEGEVRITADARCRAYGQYKDLIDARRLYSGLLAFPPRFDFQVRLLSVLRVRPLAAGHDGTRDVSEQGCVAAGLVADDVIAIPLDELPFGRAFEDSLDYGPHGRAGEPWGYHFGRSFTTENRHFTALVEAGEVFHRPGESSAVDRLAWLRPLRSPAGPLASDPATAECVAQLASVYCGRSVLLIHPGRGYLAALMAERGCRVTALSPTPSHLRINLGGTGVAVRASDGEDESAGLTCDYGLIVADSCHDSPAALVELWRKASK